MAEDFVTKLDLKKLCSEIIPQRYRLIYTTLFHSGMRPGEVLNITPSDFHKEYKEDKNKDYYFIELKKQKNKVKNELTPIPQEDYIKLIDYVRYNKIPQTGYIFGSGKLKYKKPMSVSWLNRKLKDHKELVGITKKITAHSFRSGLVVYLLDKGHTYPDIATITRHQNISVMQKHYDKRIKHRGFEILEKNFS